MTGWSFHNPVRLRFGEGVIEEIGGACAGRPYLLVTHPDPPLRPWVDRITDRCGPPRLILDGIAPNPSLAMLRGLCGRMLEEGADAGVIVALGGGSVMDSAKFLAAGHGHFEPVAAYLETGAGLPRRALPIIAIPSTAGTGSDLTKWATIWDPEQGRKLSLNRDDLYPETVLVDPLVMASLPWQVTLASGLDALSHALESIWNINANPVTRSLALDAARDVLAGLPRLRDDPRDRDARSLMARGAARAGLAFSNTQTALAHNISYPITLDHGVAHGIACSFCLPEVMIAAIGADPACDDAIEAIFGPVQGAPARLRAFLTDLGVAGSPEMLGVGADEWRTIVAQAFAGPRGRNFIGTPAHFPMAHAA